MEIIFKMKTRTKNGKFNFYLVLKIRQFFFCYMDFLQD